MLHGWCEAPSTPCQGYVLLVCPAGLQALLHLPVAPNPETDLRQTSPPTCRAGMPAARSIATKSVDFGLQKPRLSDSTWDADSWSAMGARQWKLCFHVKQLP